MNDTRPYKVILDACVLYPAPLRDLLLSLAANDLFIPKWSPDIHNEWIHNLLKNRPDLKLEQLLSTKNAMNAAFPDSNVEGYSHLIPSISLPDDNDRHVVAAARNSAVDLIVTFNIKDFPLRSISQFNITAQHPDDFLLKVFDLHPNLFMDAFNSQVSRLTNPSMTKVQVLQNLEKCGLIMIVEKLKSKDNF